MIVLYTKRLSKIWPRYDLLVKRMKNLLDDRFAGIPVEELKRKYTHRVAGPEERALKQKYLKRSTSQDAFKSIPNAPFSHKTKSSFGFTSKRSIGGITPSLQMPSAQWTYT